MAAVEAGLPCCAHCTRDRNREEKPGPCQWPQGWDIFPCGFSVCVEIWGVGIVQRLRRDTRPPESEGVSYTDPLDSCRKIYLSAGISNVSMSVAM